MGDQTRIDKIYQTARNGEFTKVLPLIDASALSRANAFTILLATSDACYRKSQKCNLESLEKLLNALMSYIDDLDEKYLYKYFVATFHILNILCKQVAIKDLAKLEKIIYPSFLKTENLLKDSKIVSTYTSTINVLSQSINSLAASKNKKYNCYILPIFTSILKAQKSLDSHKDFFRLVDICFNQLHHLGAQDQLLSFYKIILKILGDDPVKFKENADSILVQLIPIYSKIVCDLIIIPKPNHLNIFLQAIQSDIKKADYYNCHLIFQVIEFLQCLGNEEIEAHIEEVKGTMEHFRNTRKKLFDNIIHCLDQPILEVLKIYTNREIKTWKQLKADSIQALLSFLMDNVLCHSMLTPKTCSCGCAISKNYFTPAKIGCQMTHLLKLFLDDNAEELRETKEFFSQIGKWVGYIYNIIKKIKNSNCSKWKFIYTDLSSSVHNMALVLYKAENLSYKNLCIQFIKSSLEFEGLRPELLKLHTNTFAFCALSENQSKSDNTMGAMGLIALHCLLYPENSNRLFQDWIKLKVKNKKDNDIQEQTLVSALHRQANQLKNIYDFEKLFTKEKKVELLIFELTQYKAVWSSKTSMLAALDHLTEVADILTLSKVILEIYCDDKISRVSSPDMASVCSRIIKCMNAHLEKNCTIEVRLAMAVLYYYYFKVEFLTIVDKNVEEMEQTMQAIGSAKESEKIELVPKDANDECDIVSAYSNLQLSKFLPILKLLDKCVEHFGEVNIQDIGSDISKNIAKFLIVVAFEYRLQRFSVKSLQAFSMSMSIARNIQESETHLLALSYLLETADIQREEVKNLVQEGDQLLNDIESDECFNKTIAIYYLCKSKLYINMDLLLSYEFWKKAQAHCENQEMLQAELQVLLFKLTTRSCELIPREHERSPMTLKLHNAYDKCIECYKKTVLTSQDLCIVFDTWYELTKIYDQMGEPRRLRAYSKKSVLLTQKIIIPLRCVEFLLLLAQCDASTVSFNFCTVKLKGIDDIFSLSKTKEVSKDLIPEKLGCINDKLDNDIDNCTDLIRELALDMPRHTRQFSPGSPSLIVEGFKFPRFLSHQKDCLCFMCMCWDFQKLLLWKYRLNALINMYEKQDKMAEEFVAGSLTLYRRLLQNEDSYKIKTAKVIPSGLVPNLEDIFVEPYASILYDYSYHMSRKKSKDKALEINHKIIEVLKPRKAEYVYLYKEALLQRISYIAATPKLELKKEEIAGSFISNNKVFQTPIKKKSEVTIKIQAPDFVTPKPKIGKKCNLFGPEDSFKQKERNPSYDEDVFALPKTNIRNRLVPSTPVSFGTPKIQIFTSEPIKTYSRKKPGPEKAEQVASSSNGIIQDENEPTRVSPIIAGSTMNNAQGAIQGTQLKPTMARLKKTILNDQLLTNKVVLEEKNYEENKPSAVSPILTGSMMSVQHNAAQRAKAKPLLKPTKTRLTTINKDLEEASAVNTDIVELSPDATASKKQRELLLEKVKSSIKKSAKTAKGERTTRKEIKTRKNLLTDFLEDKDHAVSSDKGESVDISKPKGAVRRSARNRML
ncbi:uncharacterized protein LOC126743313 [Anthonomus grandis grandis]|uniref:uncharacterized protein LOC126743313 n=1 Tax=Anthonomus grandis grandis TaxID=2921223 RepID=UPI00216647EB|nr:uncharacterized protein LOC126743313 [Anthonomus grandis grandis]